MVLKPLTLLLLASSFTLSLTASCSTLKCADPALADKKCLVMTPKGEQKSFQYTRCTSGEGCPIVSIETSTEVNCQKVEEIARTGLIDSQVCYKDEHCVSKKCYDNSCIGLEEKKACTETRQCGYKLFCNKTTKKCDVQIPIDDKDKRVCTEDYDCVNNKGCYKGECKDYLSFPVGNEASSSLLCESGMSHVVNGVRLCVTTELQQDTILCSTVEEQCTYKVNTGKEVVEKKEKCDCSYAYSDSKFCPLDSKHKLMVDYLKALKLFFQGETHDYHTLLRQVSTNPNTRQQFLKINQFPKLYEADTCAVEVMLSGKKLPLSFFAVALIGIFLF